MSDFKLTSLVSSDEIKFKEWKIKANSKLSNGSIIFAYEYKSFKDGQLGKIIPRQSWFKIFF